MSIRIECPKCFEPHTLRDELRGKTVRCKACKVPFPVGKAPARRVEEEDEEGPLRKPAGAASRRSRFADEEDDLDAEPEERRAASGGGTSGLAVALYILLGVGGLIVLVCGGALWSFYSFSRSISNEIAKNGPPTNVDAALAGLSSGDFFRKKNGITWLGSATVDQSRQAEVIRALEPLLDDGDVFIKKDARFAYARWAGKGQVTKLIEIVRDSNIHVSDGRRAAISALGRLKDPRALPALREAAKDIFVQNEAKEALKALGENP
jgi:hypothetical protein